jgi:hypothetical protein
MQWKAAISPHDDYKYAGRLYYESLKGNANTIILVVLHIVLETLRFKTKSF